MIPVLGKLTAALVAALLAHALLFRLMRLLPIGIVRALEPEDHARLRRPTRIVLLALAIHVVLPTMRGLDPEDLGALRHLVSLLAIAGVTWLVAVVVRVAGNVIERRHDLSVTDNLEARRVHTQMTVLVRTLTVFLVIVGVAAALMTFPRVREIGASLLVSAGFAGLAIGLAARPVLENLIAGLQLAFTQPIRIDDVVIVDGEWGRVEQITATYVVVRIWDERRLVVPFGKFISESFQNWTRTSADILGTVVVHADYSVPVQAVRAELERIVENHEKWDRRVCVLQVTEAGERTMQLRALVSASNAGDAWDLRVHVREKLVEFLQREHPQCLPRTRVGLERAE